MDIKTKIKNDLWRVNYVVPFAKKYLNEEVGWIHKAEDIVRTAIATRPIKARGERTVATDTLALFNKISIDVALGHYFIYSIDEHLTLSMPGNVFSNFCLDYNAIVNNVLNDVFVAAASQNDQFGIESRRIAAALKSLRNRMIDAITQSDVSLVKKHQLTAWLSCIFERPADSFAEGLQRVLFLNQILWQTRHRLNGLGRLDKTLGDLYQKDIDSGVTTQHEAKEMVYEFLELLHGHYSFKSDALKGDIGQIIILGGLEPDGSYFRNELTDLFLQCQADLAFPDPKIFLRVSNNMPQDLLDKAVSALGAATGSPLLSNDDRVIPALISFGIEEEDAYNYCVSACWEPLIPGKSIGQNNIQVFDAGSSFVHALQKVSDDASYMVIEEAFFLSLHQDFSDFLQSLDAIKWAKDPLVSLFYPECVNKRTDISDGGAKYSNYGITVVGIGNAVASLANCKRLLASTDYLAGDLKNIIKSNFAQSEELLESLKESDAVFGSDSGGGVKMTNRITALLNEVALPYRNPLGGKVKFGLSSPAYIMRGRNAAADLSGRKNGDPYIVHISNMDASYTEIVNFAGALDYTGHRFNGNVVDFFVAPNLIKENAGKFSSFLQAAIDVGFFQMQMNVMDSATLMDAKLHPEKYPSLIVRVWGFSAYFNDLPDGYKDYLIERAKASELAA